MSRPGNRDSVVTGPLSAARHQGGQSSNRAFGLVFGAVFALIALWPLTHGNGVRYWAGIVAIGFLLLATFSPGLLALPNRVWTGFGYQLGRVVSPVVLALVYYSSVVPTGLIMRLVGKDPLKLRFDHAAPSYWVSREPKARADASMKNQF